jgi:hypothetical protein
MTIKVYKNREFFPISFTVWQKKVKYLKHLDVGLFSVHSTARGHNFTVFREGEEDCIHSLFRQFATV